MRKDVKIGLAIGGVLLAVLVVYVLVVPGNNTNQIGATLESVDGSESGSPDGVIDGGDVSAENAGASDAPDREVAARSDQSRSTGGATGGSAQNNATANGNRPTGESTSGESAGGGWNWDALMDGTERVPSLAAGADVQTNVGFAANGLPSNGATLGNTTSTNGGTVGSGAPANGGTIGNGATATNGVTRGDPSSTGNDTAQQQSAASEPLVNTTPGISSHSPARQQAALTGDARPNAEAAPTTPAASGARTHVVKAGDTFSTISAAAYGTSKHYARIELANPGVDPTRLKLGQTITLPAIDTQPAAAAAPVILDARTEYKVQPNDNLHTICLRLYGNATRVEKLYELNKAAIGDDMARVKAGIVLKLPEPPTQSTAAATSR